MNILLLHLSDLHLRTPKDVILCRTKEIAEAIGPVDRVPSAVLVAITGDVTFSGISSEYEIALNFINSLEVAIKKQFSAAAVEFVLVPGNHDCDFSRPDNVRDSILENLDRTLEVPGDIVVQAAKVQSNFVSFYEAVRNKTLLNPLLWNETFKIGAFDIAFQCLNTAWMSQRKEKPGHLIFPINDAVQSPSDLVISLLHHPYNWLTPDSGRNLREVLEATSDLILSGHEHIGSHYEKHMDEELCQYYEGGALNNSAEPANSEFNLLSINLTEKTHKPFRFKWNGANYLPEEKYFSEPLPFHRNARLTQNHYQLTDTIQKLLNDLGTTFTHTGKDILYLYDVFVQPTLKITDLRQKESTTQKIISPHAFPNYIVDTPKIVIFGDKDAGKTCLAKHTFRKLRDKKKVPLFIDGSDFTKKHTTRVKLLESLSETFAATYKNSSWDLFLQLPQDRRVIIIDNFDKCPLNGAGKGAILEAISEDFSNIIIFADSVLNLEGVTDGSGLGKTLVPFVHAEILPLGSRQKLELIKKWLIIGKEYTYSDEDLNRDIQQIDQIFRTTIKDDLLPAYPRYVSMLLQQVEAHREHTTATGSYGHLFDYVISEAIVRYNRDRLEIDIVKDYLAAFAFHLYSSQAKSITLTDFQTFHLNHCNRLGLPLKFNTIKDHLVRCFVIENINNNFKLRYNYFYFFFTALYMSRSLDTKHIKGAVEDMCSKLYREDYANILIFLAHFSKNSFLIRSALKACKEIFKNEQPCNYKNDLAVFNRLGSGAKVEEFRYIDKTPSESRIEAADAEDRANELVDTKEIEEAYNASEINRAFKAIQITGQILKSYHGTLDKSEKIEAASECFDLGLRTIGYVLRSASKNTKEGLEVIAKLLLSEGEDNRETKAALILFRLAQFAVYGIGKRVSDALGSKYLKPTFQEVVLKNPSTGHRLIDLAIRLDNFSEISADEIKKLSTEFKLNQFVLGIIKMSVLYHLSFFDVHFRLKQQICTALDIQIQYARNLSQGSRYKQLPAPKQVT